MIISGNDLLAAGISSKKEGGKIGSDTNANFSKLGDDFLGGSIGLLDLQMLSKHWGFAIGGLQILFFGNHGFNNFKLIFQIEKAKDPVVLNLSEEGKANALGTSYSYFDYDGDGFAERTAWIGDKQGLLVVDLNENGIIDDGKELFGDKTILKNGRKAKDGYQALNDVDENKDGVIDSQDSAWLKLRVWVDNGDGMTQAGELKTLEELGIETIKLNEERTGTNEEEGNILEKIGFFTKADGTTGELNDYTFEVNGMDTYNKNQVEVSAEVAEEIYQKLWIFSPLML